jgi:hypothetical protein
MQPSTKPLRRTGLDVLGDRPWGSHFCLFFDTKSDLLEILVPYFRTGLAHSEFCFWVLAPPLNEDDARRALYRAIPASDRHLIDRQMEFIPCEECYLNDGVFDLDRVTSEWGARLNGALSAGYEGIRVTGSTGWPQTREWRDFPENPSVRSFGSSCRRSAVSKVTRFIRTVSSGNSRTPATPVSPSVTELTHNPIKKCTCTERPSPSRGQSYRSRQHKWIASLIFFKNSCREEKLCFHVIPLAQSMSAMVAARLSAPFVFRVDRARMAFWSFF